MTGLAVLASQLGERTLAESAVGNALLIGFSLVGLLGAAALLGTARELRAEQRDPLNERHYIDF